METERTDNVEKMVSQTDLYTTGHLRWLSLIPLYELDKGVISQVIAALRHDFVKKFVTMPDAHPGYTFPIGTIALLDGHISPAGVGYDIGCAVAYLNTGLDVKDVFKNHRDKVEVYNNIYEGIPNGVGENHVNGADYTAFVSASGDKKLTGAVTSKANIQCGTLGSGNHFIEIGETTTGKIGITIHSGSRNVGHQIATHYMKFGDYITLECDEGQAYLQDMNYALQFAFDNRAHMMKKVLNILGLSYVDAEKLMSTLVNHNHNHAIVTPEGVLHRKGAIPADKGQIGIIPGSMKSGVYVTVGLGNEKYLSSASHGAGRLCSRSEARKRLTLHDFRKEMNEADIVASVREETLDESNGAYKDLNTVINYQKGIVIDVVDFVRPLINVKGIESGDFGRKRKKKIPGS